MARNKEFKTNAQEVAKQVKKDCDEYRAEVYQNIEDAAREMVAYAKSLTPPNSNQSINATGTLADHWSMKVLPNADGSVYVTLSNDMQYASFVENGFNLKRHFVPWLYIDESGLLKKHNPISGEMLFGLVVGTKTKSIPPANIVPRAQEHFQEVFEMLMQQTNAKFGIAETGDKHDGATPPPMKETPQGSGSPAPSNVGNNMPTPQNMAGRIDTSGV